MNRTCEAQARSNMRLRLKISKSKKQHSSTKSSALPAAKSRMTTILLPSVRHHIIRYPSEHNKYLHCGFSSAPRAEARVQCRRSRMRVSFSHFYTKIK